MNQKQYINKLKLIELEKKKIDIEKKSSKGQMYLNSTVNGNLGLKTKGFLGTTMLRNN